MEQSKIVVTSNGLTGKYVTNFLSYVYQIGMSTGCPSWTMRPIFMNAHNNHILKRLERKKHKGNKKPTLKKLT